MDLNTLTAARIKEVRSELGITSEALAIDLGVSKSTVSQLENGKVNITIPTIEKVAGVLKVPVSALIPIAHSSLQINRDHSQNNFLNSSIVYSSNPELISALKSSLDLIQSVISKLNIES